MFVNRIRIRVEFGDCDPGDIVFFANYFRWFDRCTSALFRAAGMPLKQLLKSHGAFGIPLVDARARYILPSTYGDELMVESCVTKWGRSSFVISHKFLADGKLAAEGWETHVWVTRHPTEPNRMKSAPIPKEVRQKLSVAKQTKKRKA